jgi:hypothetical protein
MRITAALLLVFLLASPARAEGPEAPFTETTNRRLETVFFISLPFTSLYSGIFMLGISAAVQKGDVRFTVPYQATTAGLALLASGWIAWHDKKTGGPDLSEVERAVPPGSVDLAPK